MKRLSAAAVFVVCSGLVAPDKSMLQDKSVWEYVEKIALTEADSGFVTLENNRSISVSEAKLAEDCDVSGDTIVSQSEPQRAGQEAWLTPGQRAQLEEERREQICKAVNTPIERNPDLEYESEFEHIRELNWLHYSYVRWGEEDIIEDYEYEGLLNDTQIVASWPKDKQTVLDWLKTDVCDAYADKRRVEQCDIGPTSDIREIYIGLCHMQSGLQENFEHVYKMHSGNNRKITSDALNLVHDMLPLSFCMLFLQNNIKRELSNHGFVFMQSFLINGERLSDLLKRSAKHKCDEETEC